jgi:(p)ppGpp synthase/HD superfamily hydrolase
LKDIYNSNRPKTEELKGIGMREIKDSNIEKLEEKAYEIAIKAHRGQVDKGGNPYIEHVLRVADSFEHGTKVRIVALLLDVVEDTDYTIEDIVEEGFDDDIIAAVRVITKAEETEYMSYIEQVALCKLASMVKMTDLKDNMDLTRIKEPTEKDYKRVERYQKALAYIEKNNGEDKI